MQVSNHQIKYGSKSISYQLHFAKRKSLGIKVQPSGAVIVVAPMLAAEKDIAEKVKAKAAWILKQQLFFSKYQPKTPTRKYINGETHLYLGRQYKLKILKGVVEEVKLYRGEMIVNTTKKSSNTVETIIQQWYLQKAKTIFETLLAEQITNFKKYKISTPKLYIRSMQKRWGSCTSAGKILLNTALVKAPKPCIEYVIVHELCHLVYWNHKKDFYKLLSKLIPDWERLKERLEMKLN